MDLGLVEAAAPVVEDVVKSQATTTTPRVVLVAPSSSYRTGPFIRAASSLGIQLSIASPGKYALVQSQDKSIHLDFQDEQACINTLRQEHRDFPIHAIIGCDEITTQLAARLSHALQIRPSNPVTALQTTRRKDLARQALRTAGLLQPLSKIIDLNKPILAPVDFPGVLKPLSLSASRGVIRVNNQEEYVTAVKRIQKILQDLKHLENYERDHILWESYIPGTEIAVEGLLQDGKLRPLAIFDKPDPMDGPYFEETYYISPSALPKARQDQVYDVVQKACQAYGLMDGPIHAECRLNQEGIWILEVAARTIGGLCGTVFEYILESSLEELVLRHVLNWDIPKTCSSQGVGSLMIPIPKAGMLHRVRGVLQAQNIPFIEDVDIYVQNGNQVVPLPEGASYLGFIFARAPSAAQAEHALRQAHACLDIDIKPIWNLNIGDNKKQQAI